MAVSVNWNTKVITIPKADTTLVSAGPPEIREYDVYESFWKELKAIEADEGIPFLDTQRHFTTVTVGGVTLAHVVEIINGYTVTFENGSYQVNLFGANHNVLDVANLNQVGLRSSNSAGLVEITSGSGLSAEQNTWLQETHQYATDADPLIADTNTVVNAQDIVLAAIQSGLTAQDGVIDEIYQLLGLKSGSPLQIEELSETQIQQRVGAIVINAVKAGAITTVSRP